MFKNTLNLVKYVRISRYLSSNVFNPLNRVRIVSIMRIYQYYCTYVRLYKHHARVNHTRGVCLLLLWFMNSKKSIRLIDSTIPIRAYRANNIASYSIYTLQ